MTRGLAVAAFVILAGACTERRPTTAPTAVLAPSPPPAVGTATLAITNVVVTRTGPTRHDNAISFAIVETSGTVGARITQLRFQLLDAGPARADGVMVFGPFLLGNDRIPPGGSTTVGGVDPYGWPLIEIGSSFDATRVSIEVAFVDDAGHTGTVGAVANILSASAAIAAEDPAEADAAVRVRPKPDATGRARPDARGSARRRGRP